MGSAGDRSGGVLLALVLPAVTGSLVHGLVQAAAAGATDEQLEQALAGYEGTLLLVTHDRRMLDVVDTTRRLEVTAGKVVEA